MAAPYSTNFQRYLESVCTTYQRWWSLYTLTDAVSQQQVGQEKLPSVFDFGLMVETVKPQLERGEAREETERLPVLDGLRKYAAGHVLLVGRPGSGKSTALARLLVEKAQSARSPLNPPLERGEEELELEPPLKRGAGGIKTQIPVLLELRQYKTSVLDLIRDFLMRHRLRLNSAEIETLLFEGRFLLLIDGLNELPTEAARRDLKAFRQNYAATSMIFTTRDLGVKGDLGIEKKLEMQPLTEAQMQQFVRAYLPQQSDQMLRQLRDRLRELGQTPLLLEMLCDLFSQTDNIPPNLGMVFRCFAQGYDRKIKEDVPVSEESRRWWQELLQHLAFVMIQGETPTELRVTISRQEAETVLTEFLQGKVDYPPSRAKEWLEDLLEHHLIQVASNDQIEFRHQLLQEYYAAECLLQQLPHLNDGKLKRDYLNYLKWTEPIALMLALPEVTKKQAVKVVNLALEVDLMLGARLAGEVKPEFQEETVSLIARFKVPSLLKTELLAITRSNNTIPPLIQALNHQDYLVYEKVIEALGAIGNQAAVDALVKALNHEDSYVCSAAIYELKAMYKLGKIDNKTAVEASIQALNHKKYGIRLQAVQLLRDVGNREAVDALIQALKDERGDVRGSAASALGAIGNPIAILPLRQALKYKDFETRPYVVEALKDIRNPPVHEPRDYDYNYNFEHEDNEDKWSLLKELGGIDNPAEVTQLIQALKHEHHIVRIIAASELGEIGNQMAVTPLIQALKDKYYEVCSAAAEALGKIGAEAAVAPLVEALNHEEETVCKSAVKALGKIGNPEAVAALLHALNHNDEFVRQYAADELGNSGGSELLPHLSNLLLTVASAQTDDLLNAIYRIQERCQFYNYTIATFPPPQEETNADPLSHTLNRLNQTLTTMSEIPKYDFSGASFGSITGSVTGDIQGDINIGTQNNYAPEQKQKLAEAAKEIQQLLDQLEQTNPTTSETQLIANRAIERQPMLKEPQVIEQAIKSTPTLKQRLRSAGTAAYLETVKTLLPPASIVIETIKAWKNPEE